MVNNSDASIDQVFQAMSSSTRRSILQTLARGERTVGELAEPYDMSIAAVSKHIEVLERAGLVLRTRAGRTTRCQLKPEMLLEAARVLDYYRSFWNDQLDAFDHYFRSQERG